VSGSPSYSFVAYIDESGDHGTRSIGNHLKSGPSEWFVIGAVVISAQQEMNVGRWQRETIEKFGYTQRKDIHFKELSDARRRTACEQLAAKPVRLFVAMSNKKNMQNYRNLRPRYDPDWFYRWMTRILLERVTLFCSRWATGRSLGERRVKLVFSRNSWIDYERTKKYLSNLQNQSRLGTMFNRTGDISWDVVDLDLVHAISHKHEAGLQFADVLASAFYRGVALDNKERRCDPEFAQILRDRVYAPRRDDFLGNGIKTMPPLAQMGLEQRQRRLFEFYGYPPEKW
jgi:hypothetical protein